nr:MAG TPA: tail fiber protein [Caudoviricetes sp.]
MRLVTTFIQNTESTDPDLSYLNRARFVLSVADGHGSDGVGILDAVIRNRHLFLSMTSGAEIDAGSVFTEDDLPVASDSRLGIAAFDPAYFSILAGKVSLRGDLDFGLNETQLAEYLTANKYATQAWVAAQGFIGSDGLALYATKEWVLGQNFAKASSLGNYLLKSVWDEVFEVTTVNGVRVLNVKLDIAGLKGISAYGLGSTSGGSASGSLGELVNVGQWADEVPTADRVMVQLAGTTHWSAKPLADLVGLDTAALAQYLTANSYLKASDISSYLTWANLSGKPTVYPTNWANIADKPTVYPTTWTSVTGRPTKLSQFTDDVVAGNYLPKPTWDAVFEVVTVDGTPALKVKYDILGLKGITAYADGTLSGGFSGALVDLVDVVVTNLASGDILKYNGTHFVNVPVSSIAGASSWDQITGKPEYFPTRWADVSGAPTSLPASDVYPWAKAATKPTYTAAEVGALALSGGVLAGDVYLGGGLAIRDNTASHSNVIGLLNTGDGTFFTAVGSGNRRMVLYSSVDLYRDNGSTQYRIYDSSNFNPSSKLDKSVWDEAFELKTVNGVRVISAKLDFLSVAGISAYATGPSSGGGGGGLDYDLLKQALTGAITPDGYPFTISASFLGAIDKTYLTGKLANTYANKVHTHLWTDITDRPTSLPANGGNADTVDNLHGSSFAQIKSYTYPDGGINNITDLDFTGNIQAHFPGHEYSCIWQGKDFRGVIFQLKLKDYYTQSMMYRGGETKTWMTVWDSGNFNPANKFGFSADQLSDLNNAPNNAFFVGAYNATNSPVQNSWSNGFTIAYGNNTDFRKQFCYAGEKWWTRGRDGVNWGTWRQIWDSGNLNPGNYLLLSGGTMTGDIAFGSNGRSLRGSDGGNIAGVLYDTPNARYVTAIGTGSRRLILVSPASIYRGAGGVAENYMIYDSGNFNPDNYLPLSGNKMITGDFQFKDGVSVRDAAGRSVVGLLDVAGDGVCVVVGNSAKKTRIVTPNDTPVYRNDGKGAYRIYDSSNSNISTVDWAAKNITAAGTVTATKLVLGGITIDVYNGALRVNGNLVATGGVTSLATA